MVIRPRNFERHHSHAGGCIGLRNEACQVSDLYYSDKNYTHSHNVREQSVSKGREGHQNAHHCSGKRTDRSDTADYDWQAK